MGFLFVWSLVGVSLWHSYVRGSEDLARACHELDERRKALEAENASLREKLHEERAKKPPAAKEL